jgi:hypothetical protein
MKGIVFLAVALVSVPAAAAAQQTELGGKVRSGREVIIPASETVRGDLVATGGTVRVDGRVDGDLVASGGQVIVAGTVGGDVLVGVVLGLAGLGSLTGVAVVGGLLVAAMLVFLLVLAVGFAAPATVGLALGRLLVRDQGRWFGGGLGALAIGVLVVVLVAAIPVAGGFLEALVVLLGLGALLLTARAGRPRVAQPSA